MRTINPQCSDNVCFLSSIVISLHYYDLLPHPKRLSKIKECFKKYELAGNIPESFEYCNKDISLTVYDKKGQIRYNSKNNANKKAYLVQINNNRYNALKPKMTREMKLEKALSQFTHKEITSYILNKIMTN